jgi:hypothetical protein
MLPPRARRFLLNSDLSKKEFASIKPPTAPPMKGGKTDRQAPHDRLVLDSSPPGPNIKLATSLQSHF